MGRETDSGRPDPVRVARELGLLAAEHPDPLPLLEAARALLAHAKGRRGPRAAR